MGQRAVRPPPHDHPGGRGGLTELACPDTDAAPGAPLCRHAWDAAVAGENIDVARWYVGRGVAYVAVCDACADVAAGGGEPLVVVPCVECRDLASHYVYEGLLRVVGSPEVWERPEPFRHTLAEIPLPGLPARLVDLACAERERRWFGLCADGTVVDLADDWSVTALARCVLPEEGAKIRPRLHVARSGRYAAVVNDYGMSGRVVDLRDGATTMVLRTRAHYENLVRFSAAFAQLDGRDVLVHRTRSGRLDVSDPATGVALTFGRPTSDEYDQFHGRLQPNPAGTMVLDDAWAWHPVGVPTVWAFGDWLPRGRTPDGGPDRRRLSWRDYFWDCGMCWVDDYSVAVFGLGSDDDAMVDGVTVFDVKLGPLEVTAFAGPTGELFSDGTRLFSASAGDLSVWDVATGARTAVVPGFAPTRHARARAELVEVRTDGVRVCRYEEVPGADAQA